MVKREKTCFSQAGDRPTTPSCPRNVSKNEKPTFDDDVILDDTILDDDVMYIGQITNVRDLTKI